MRFGKKKRTKLCSWGGESSWELSAQTGAPLERSWEGAEALAREAVDAPSLQMFRAGLDGAWSDLLWRKVSLPMARLEMGDL